MAPRNRFLVALLLVTLIAAFCGSRVSFPQDRAKPRDERSAPAKVQRKGEGRSKPGRRESGATTDDSRARRPQPDGRAEESGRDRSDDGARRRDAEQRHPQPGVRPDSGRGDRQPSGPSYDARRRHPQPDGRYERRYPQWHRYHWRNWGYRDRWHRDRFPRFFFGIRLFDGYFYMGRPFGPHYGLWQFRDHGWWMFYWPFPYPPARGCGWYRVPTQRVEYLDPYTGEYYWDYTDYDWVYVCID